MLLHPFKRFSIAAAAVAATLLLGSCGGGGGGGDPGGDCPVTGCPPPDPIDIRSGFTGNLDWDTGGDGSGGVGAGADGDGGVGAGGDFGQFRGARVTAWRLADGRLIGSALTDDATGMVTIRPGRTYNGALLVEISGTATATYYEEGRKEFVPFPADRKIRVIVPAISRNVGATPFTEAAYRLLTEGSTAERAPNPQQPTQAQIRAANERVRAILNQQFPSLLAVDDITRLPFIKSPAVEGQRSLRNDPRGRYGVVNGAFSKQAALFNGDRRTPTLDATRHLSEDLLDGQLDGRNQTNPAVGAAERTYDPNTLTGELSSALAEQAARFGNTEVLGTLPPVTSFGNVRYEGYLFDGAVNKDGVGRTTVAGWLGDNTQNRTVGQSGPPKGMGGNRAFTLMGNMGHGGGFFKADTTQDADLRKRSRVFALGDNVNGELGIGSRVDTDGLTVELNLPGALVSIAGGFAHTVAVMADGAVYTWGDNSFGQLGLGQSADALPRALTPQRVNLPLPALAVAATNVTSFALLNDGTVWAWGSGGGFGLLGDGTADGSSLVPVKIPGNDVANVVQLVARDNDVLVLRRDNTVWQWGSHPADPSAFVPGDPSQPYLGGNRTPTQVAGLPAGIQVRKILTEQGLFAALLANGHVYSWGVHFDITAGQILRDLQARRVLGLPPIRDMMPGGFVGYGVRAFDRLTSMGVDYRGGMWKIRGRVAEVFDPANPAAQRRPQNQGPRVDCEACHTFLDESLAEILARSQQPTTITPTTPECLPPSSVHQGQTASLIHFETDCVQCHNPSRLSYPATTPSGNIPFASSGGWPNCVKPANLPNRTAINPPLLTNSCQIPPAHPFTPPGTICASCHNSVIARPLSQTTTPCAQPLSNELPTIRTNARVIGAFDDSGTLIADGSLTRDRTPELRGALTAALASGQSLQVLRNGAPAGVAVVTGTSWTFTDSAPDGAQTYAARVVDASSGFSANSNVTRFTIDSTAPTATATVVDFTDDALGSIAIGTFMTDTTPTVNGTLSAALGAGESLQVLRNGVLVGTATVTGTSWRYVEPTALVSSPYSYQVRPIDAAGNVGAASNSGDFTLLGGLPSPRITTATDDRSQAIDNGGASTDNTPTFSGTLNAPLRPGYVVRMFRNSVYAGDATVDNQALTWTLTAAAAPDGNHYYEVRVEAGKVLGQLSPGYIIDIDTVPPTQVAGIASIEDDANGVLANNATTYDTTPIINGSISAPLAAGERVQLIRNGNVVATFSFGGTTFRYTEPDPILPAPPATSVTLTYTARVIDIAGQLGPNTGASRIVTIAPGNIPLPNAAATITTVNGRTPTSPLEVNYSTAGAVVNGTLQRALQAGETLNVYRNTSTPVVPPTPTCASGVVVGSLTQAQLGAATTFSVTTSGPLAAGSTYFFAARIDKGPAVCGASNNTAALQIVAAPSAPVTEIRDDANFLYPDNALTADTTPRVVGTIGRAPLTGEQLEVLRNGGVASTQPWTGTGWSFTETVARGAGTYTYTARSRDAFGNLAAVAAARSIQVVTNLPNASITSITGVANGARTNDTTPTVNINIGTTLPAGYAVRVLRNGSFAGFLTTCNTTCSFTESPALPATGGTTYTYTARTEAGGATASVAGTALGTLSAGYSMVLDTTPPTAPTFDPGTVNEKPFRNQLTTSSVTFNSGSTVEDPSPTLNILFSGALGTSERVEIWRANGAFGAFALMTTFTNGSSAAYTDPVTALTTANDGAPAVNVSQRRYFARRYDAAGNSADSAVFTVNYDHVDCSAPRAYFISSANHAGVTATDQFGNRIWAAAGNTQCTGCHTAPTQAGWVAAPAPSILPPVRYWCRKP